MAVLSVTEIYDGRGGSTSDKRTDTRLFRVITDSGRDTKFTIEKSGMVPTRGSPHHTESDLTCKEADGRQDSSVSSPCHWIWTAKYDNLPFTGVPQLAAAIEPNPLLRPIEIEGRSLLMRRSRERGYLIATKTMADWKDGEGQKIPSEQTPLRNTALEPFTGFEENDPIWVVQVTMNMEAIQDWVNLYQDTVNDRELQVRGYTRPFPKWSLRFMGWTHSKLLAEKLPSGLTICYYQTIIELYYRRKLWVTPILNNGWNELIDGDLTPILKKGIRPSSKALLDENGKKIDTPTASNALYRFYGDGSEADYSVFKLS